MTKSEIVEHLKNSTVKIDNASRVGTGFFIADKLIATCYHNIKGHSKDEHKVYWQGEAYSVTSIEINQDDDLALLEIKIDKKHPILQIDKSVEVGDECQSFGYSRKNGDVITFEYEGRDGDGRLKFKEGLFQSGLSGGAILNFRTHKICGIVKSKRDNTESVALGGRGIPISKLFGFERLDIDNNGSIFSKEMFKNWVWTSSVESADRLQFSVLALLETLVAVGLSFFVWIYHGFYWHIVTGLVVAPLFFLRTIKSKKIALSFFKKLNKNEWILSLSLLISFIFFIKVLMYYPMFNVFAILVFIILGVISSFLVQREIKNIFFKILFILISPIWGGLKMMFELYIMMGVLFPVVIVSKFYAIIRTFSFFSIQKIPLNWYRNILCTDSFKTHEIIEGFEKEESHKSSLLISDKYIISYIKKEI